ncbi:wall-associated receptor kinase 2 isoform X12 [Populus trichocarpa]|uniref:wall-associated receptor kinase 2 isoform X11 n=1 Tax=Populus trichocarpa TaxID=3694 RepID=UPI0022787B28|nr:wall-associated receptor kinase 2 isoform X11 [Populus trichocarpa]XP_052308015.1 wall-associated receptor kinase 2 isoform X12 [Populus trichocarpa]
MWVFLLMMSLLSCPAAASTASPDVKPGCQDKCGDVSVPYPFGIGEQSCAMNKPFFLNCTSGADGQPELLFGRNMPVRKISQLNGTVTVGVYTASDCYNETAWNRTESSVTLGSGPFMFSDTLNVFTGIGCDTSAQVINKDRTYGAACLSICTENVSLLENNPCSGSGCCQTSIPRGLKSLNISTSSYNNHANVSDFNPCGFAFLVDRSSLKLSDWPLSRKPKYGNDAYATDVVIEWVVKNETCEKANKTSAYACGSNANCTDSENQGYRCLCEKGFEGNPYLQDGCQDKDECKDPGKNPCEEGTCENVIGDYKCRCPLGKYGDGKTGCKGPGIVTIIAAVGASIFLVVICLLLYMICTKRKKEKNFQENGGKFLKNQRVRIFSEAELVKATNNYADDRKLGEGSFGSVYKGVLTDNTVVAVKKSKGVDKAQMNAEFQKEMSIVSQVNHKNVVKLLGLCLETKVPLLVYEFISNGTLSKHIHDKGSRILASWTNRLRVASETALALDYLHSLADPPVIHGDVKSVNILLDSNYTAKVADFGASVLMSPGKTDILATKIQGTLGYLDPEYLMTGILTVQSDVYSFGVVLVELLTGEMPNSISKSGEKRNVIQHFISALENNHLFKILDFQTADEGEMDEIEAVAELAKGCLNSMGVNRPTMKEVSDELAKLKALHQKSLAHENSEETDHLLGESSQSFCKNIASPPMDQSQTVISLQIENYTNSN